MKRSAYYGIPQMPVAWLTGLVLVLATAGCASTGSEPPPAPATATAKPAAEPPPAAAKPAEPAVAVPVTPAAPPPVTQPASEKPASAAAAPEKAPVKVAAKPAPKEPAAKKPAAASAPEKPAAPPLDLDALEQRLKETNAIGVFTKLTLKNQVDELVDRFKDYYAGRAQTTLTQLRQPYDLLILKVLTLLQDGDPSLANAIRSSREAIWGILSDPAKFSKLAS